jgi:hypothetical protein
LVDPPTRYPPKTSPIPGSPSITLQDHTTGPNSQDQRKDLVTPTARDDIVPHDFILGLDISWPDSGIGVHKIRGRASKVAGESQDKPPPDYAVVEMVKNWI